MFDFVKLSVLIARYRRLSQVAASSRRSDQRAGSDSEGPTDDVVEPSADDDWQSGNAGDQRRQRLVSSGRCVDQVLRSLMLLTAMQGHTELVLHSLRNI